MNVGRWVQEMMGLNWFPIDKRAGSLNWNKNVKRATEGRYSSHEQEGLEKWGEGDRYFRLGKY